ncbi:hypothetical protein H5181_20155 [Shewanella sp. SG44-2]|uniref:hypothetical protein n=1 Tax=Shewanella sp. SG44-2 TaxID=2760962 RepID=UPI0015FF53B7|nr:hypothetical protein [Shewanella sp. SG44-2]MBB1428743.1 hypothetical protein [Shewanella sp. SG44-2]
MNYLKLVDTAKKDWESRPNLAEACERLINAVHGMAPNKFRHMTFSYIKNLSGVDLESTDVVLVTQYLCGDRIRLFDAGFEYITDTENFILDDDNSYFAMTENAIAHPISGDVIHDVKSDVYMFFTLAKNEPDNES